MFVLVTNDADFDLVSAQIHNRLVERLTGYGAQSTTWATKRFSDGGTGYYLPLPVGSRDFGFDDIIGERPTYETLPTQVPAGSYTLLTETVNEIYDQSDIINIGAFSSGIVLSEIYFLRKPNDDGDFIITIFRDSGEITILNVSDNTYKYLNSGIFKPWKPIYHELTDSITFFAAGGDQIKIYTYYMDSDTVFESDILEAGEGIQSRKIGTDNLIYFGAQASTKVFSFDPISQNIEEYGPMMESGSTYVYDIAGDSNFVYSILRGPYNTLRYWVAIYNKTTTNITLLGYDNVFTQYVPFSLFQDGANIFWRLQLQSSSSSPNLVIELQDGVQVDYNTTINLSLQSQGYLPLEYNNIENWPSTFGYQVDIKELTITSLLRYKTVSDLGYTDITFTEVNLIPLGSRFVNLNDDEILRAVGAYSQLTRIDPTNDVVIESKDMPDASIYDAIKVGTKIYFSGYANITAIWDTEQPWNLGQYALTNPLSNPRQLPFNISGGFYHYRLINLNDYIYIGINKERTTVGITIAWFNKETLSLGNTDTNLALKNELAGYSFCELLTVDNKLILVGRNKTTGGKSRIWIWDISSNFDINSITPTRLDLDSAVFRPSSAFLFSSTTLVLIDYRNICKVDLTGVADDVYRSVPTSINMSDSSRYDFYNDNLYFLGVVSGNQYFYSIDITNWTFTRLSSAFDSTLYGPRITTIIDGVAYFVGTQSITQFNGEISGAWVEKLEL